MLLLTGWHLRVRGKFGTRVDRGAENFGGTIGALCLPLKALGSAAYAGRQPVQGSAPPGTFFALKGR